MGLIKDIIADNGMKATYSRINKIEKKTKSMDILLDCYLTEEYRNKEKKKEEIINDIDNIYQRMSFLSSLEVAEQLKGSEKTEYEKLQEDLNYISNEKDYRLFQKKVTIDYIPESAISFEDIYKKLETMTI